MKDQWIEWLQEKQRHFFYGVILIVASLFVAFQLFGKFHKPPANRYLVANQAFERWMLQGEAFEKLETALQTHPELEAKFGALIADKFISQNEADKAHPFAENVFRRVLTKTPEHTAYAINSLLIAEGNFKEALLQSISLKDRLEETSLLYGFNLIRIASLNRTMDMRDQELVALGELEHYLQANEKASSILMECFKESDVTIHDYISHRKNP